MEGTWTSPTTALRECKYRKACHVKGVPKKVIGLCTQLLFAYCTFTCMAVLTSFMPSVCLLEQGILTIFLGQCITVTRSLCLYVAFCTPTSACLCAVWASILYLHNVLFAQRTYMHACVLLICIKCICIFILYCILLWLHVCFYSHAIILLAHLAQHILRPICVHIIFLYVCLLLCIVCLLHSCMCVHILHVCFSCMSHLCRVLQDRDLYLDVIFLCALKSLHYVSLINIFV